MTFNLQAQSQLTAAQERNSRAVGKLEDSLAGEVLALHRWLYSIFAFVQRQ